MGKLYSEINRIEKKELILNYNLNINYWDKLMTESQFSVINHTPSSESLPSSDPSIPPSEVIFLKEFKEIIAAIKSKTFLSFISGLSVHFKCLCRIYV